ncbi:MAG: hypothetical protein WCP30_09445 [Mycobacteriaceae bacterium]
MKDTLRAGATAIGVATGLLALASTAQTPDGYIHASFGGPLDVFSSSSSSPAEVLAIGDGTNDASELAALLKGPVGLTPKDGGNPNSPYRVAYEAGATPSPITGSMTVPPMETPATAAPTRKDAAILPSKPVVDSQGKIDCSGSLSCHTDPTTNITTVTYPDGVVAIVQKINDLTVVAYKTLTGALPTQISSLLPPVPTTPLPQLAAVAPAPVPTATPTAPVIAPQPVVTPQAPETASASIDPGPPAPSPNLDVTNSGPKINVTTPPKDFSAGTGTGTNGTGTGTNLPAPNVPSLGGAVKDTIGGVVDAVKGAVSSALSPGASSKPESSDGSNSSNQSSTSDSSKSNSSKSDSSGGNSSNGS